MFCLAGLAGCGSAPKLAKWGDTPRVLNETQRTALGRVAVVADSEPPMLTLEGYSQGRWDGARTAYTGSFKGCMGATGAWALSQAAYATAYSAYWALTWVSTALPCGVVAVVGVPVGWAFAPADATLVAHEAQVIAAVRRNAVSVPLRRELLRRIQAEPLPKGVSLVTAKDAPDTLVQLSITSVRLQGPGWGNRPLSLVIDAEARCLPVARTAQPQTCHLPLRFVAPSAKLSAWAANDAAAMRQAIQAGIQQFAAQTHAALFKGTTPKDPPKARRGEYF